MMMSNNNNNNTSVIEIRRLGEFAVEDENRRTRGIIKDLEFISVEDYVMESNSDCSIYFLALRAKCYDDDPMLYRTALRVPVPPYQQKDDGSTTFAWESIGPIIPVYEEDRFHKKNEKVKVPKDCDILDQTDVKVEAQTVANFAVLHHNEKYKLRQLELVGFMHYSASILPEYVEYTLDFIVYDHAIARKIACQTKVVKYKRSDFMKSMMRIKYLYYYPFPDVITLDLVSIVRTMFQSDDFFGSQCDDDKSIHQLSETAG